MKKIVGIFLSLSFFMVCAQEEEANLIINTDRPTQSASAYTMEDGKFQIEYGFIYESTSLDIQSYTLGNFLFRYGVLEGLELRLTQNILQTRTLEPVEQTETGLSPTTIGAKLHIVEETGIIPQTSFIGQVTFDNGNRPFQISEGAVTELRLNMQHNLSDRIALAYNFGVVIPQEENYFLYTAMMGYSFLKGWTFFVEPYGFLLDGEDDHRINAGVIYLVKNNLQLDISAGAGLSEISPDSFIGLGAAIFF